MQFKEFLTQDVSFDTIKTKFKELNPKNKINKIMQSAHEFSTKHAVALRICLAVIFAFIVFWQSWHADDAYHGYIMARHLAEGKGLVYNVGYRVNASTCPLLTLLDAGIFKLIHNMEATSVIIGVASSGVAATVLFFKFCKKFRYAIFAFIAMIMSYCFMSYTASGLENSMLFLFGALFLSCYFSNDEFNAKNLYVLALLLALLAMTRMDTVLIFIPMIVSVYLFKTKVKFVKRVGIGFLGLLPFILWEVFSILYYGFPFPNTLYAKVYSGYPLSDYLVRGFRYLYDSYLFDCFLIIIPSIFLLLLIHYRSKKGALLFSGLALYTIYTVRIGGDFMAGRHLTLSFFLALCGACALLSEQQFVIGKNSEEAHFGWLQKLRPGKLAAYGTCLSLVLLPILKPIAEDNFSSPQSDISDEKAYYVSVGHGTIDMLKMRFSNEPDRRRIFRQDLFTEIEQAWKNGDKGFLDPGYEYMGVIVPKYLVHGFVVYFMADVADMYLTDQCALMDPLLTRVPCIDTKRWRIGHNLRIIPEGYVETVRTGKNQIVDPSLHEYYDKMLLIISGDLFDGKRLETIWNMNIGKYDYLLEEYKRTIAKENQST
ncbi:MAG: hypothetical protein IJU23_07585 [Proteobacteria bacterium]|nr:hypothetical protein [Pseudomonadota bacterium]